MCKLLNFKRTNHLFSVVQSNRAGEHSPEKDCCVNDSSYWGLDNLCGSHHQSEVNSYFQSNGLLRLKLISQLSRDVIVS